MEEAETYEQSTREELIQIIVELKQIVRDQNEIMGALKKEIERLKPPQPKDSTNSSIPSSKELIPRTRSQREKSGKKPGGQKGHRGYHRERNADPEAIIEVQANQCKRCGASLEAVEGRIGQIAQEVDIPIIRPFTTEYRQV